MNIRSFKSYTPKLESGVFIDPMATVIGDVHLETDVSIWPMTCIRGDVNTIHIGANSNIQDGSVIHVSRNNANGAGGYPTNIGENVTIGHKVMLHGCTIGSRVLVGMGAIVLDGAVIEDDVIIGAGTLVTPGKQLSSGYLYTGSPVRKTRALNKGELAQFVSTAANYVELKNHYIKELEQFIKT